MWETTNIHTGGCIENCETKTLTYINIDTQQKTQICCDSRMMQVRPSWTLTKDIVFFFSRQNCHSHSMLQLCSCKPNQITLNWTRWTKTMERHACLSLTCMAGQAKAWLVTFARVGLVRFFFPVKHKQGKNQNQAFAYSNDWTSDIKLGIDSLIFFVDLGLHIAGLWFVHTMLVQYLGQRYFVQCS